MDFDVSYNIIFQVLSNRYISESGNDAVLRPYMRALD